MVDFRAFRGLRYTPLGGDLSDLISPPYDVLSAAQVEALKDGSPYNIIRLEHPVMALAGEREPYEAAASLLNEWQGRGILRRDDAPAFHLHAQTFTEGDHSRQRRVIYGRLKLTSWDDGEVVPHEYTMAGPKEDRLRLLRALNANTSPLYLLYNDSDGDIASLLPSSAGAGQTLTASADAESHALTALVEPDTVQRLQTAFAERRLYMADGHHRYETALAHHNTEGSAETAYVLAGLTASNDPGLSIHATHRLFSGEFDPRALRDAIDRDFELQPVSRAELKELLSGEELALGLGGLDSPSSLVCLRPRNLDSLASRTPGDAPEVSRRLDVSLLQHIVLGDYLGLDPAKPDQAGLVYVHSLDDALDTVANHGARLAFLLRPVSPKQLIEVSDAGARLPQKTTYFSPKLPTGLVMNLLD